MVMAAQRRGHEAGNRAWRAEDGPNPLDFTRESVLAKLVRDTGDAGRYVFTVDGSRERRETAVNSLRLGSGHFATMRGLADRKSTRLNSSHQCAARMPSSA